MIQYKHDDYFDEEIPFIENLSDVMRNGVKNVSEKDVLAYLRSLGTDARIADTISFHGNRRTICKLILDNNKMYNPLIDTVEINGCWYHPYKIRYIDANQKHSKVVEMYVSDFIQFIRDGVIEILDV